MKTWFFSTRWAFSLSKTSWLGSAHHSLGSSWVQNEITKVPQALNTRGLLLWSTTKSANSEPLSHQDRHSPPWMEPTPPCTTRAVLTTGLPGKSGSLFKRLYFSNNASGRGGLKQLPEKNLKSSCQHQPAIRITWNASLSLIPRASNFTELI